MASIAFHKVCLIRVDIIPYLDWILILRLTFTRLYDLIEGI
jgi:hypothetical protein